nr:MAG TPA: hypothetical protein [Caudoviricetes sp.]
MRGPITYLKIFSSPRFYGPWTSSISEPYPRLPVNFCPNLTHK